MMSNVHFALECDGQHCRIRDLKSRFGTQVNQSRVADAMMRNGDRITAGNTNFVFWLVSDQMPPEPVGCHEAGTPTELAVVPQALMERLEREPPGELAGIRDRVIQLLRQQPGALYALLDAARDPRVLARLANSGEEYQSLYEGPKGEAMADFGPFLVCLRKDASLLETLIHEGWGNCWGVYLICDQPFKEVRKHFRNFLTVRLPDGKEVYFRFYDPRVLRVFLATLNREETEAFFGPVRAYYMEDAKPAEMLSFTARNGSTFRERISLALRNPTVSPGVTKSAT